MKSAFTSSLSTRSLRLGCRHLGLAALLAASTFVALESRAADGPPPLMSFQTRILDSVGAPLANSTKDVIFRIYGVESGATPLLWAEKQTVAIKDGYISVILGQGGPLPSPSPNVELASIFPGVGDAERYIEVEVDGTKISPRLRLLPSAYSFVSGVALRLVANSIEPGMLRDNAVGSAAINAGAVTDAKLGVGAVSTTKIADGAVTEAKLGAAAVSAAKIAANAVGTTQIADSAVTSAKIADSTIATADLANLAVTEAKLGDAAVGTAKLGDKAVTTAKLADGNVTAAKIADANVTLPKLAAGIFSTSTYTLTFGDSSTSHDTGVGATWYPVLSSIYWGDGDLNENGTGDLGGARLFLFQGTWRLRANLRTHVNDANATIRVLWVPRVLIAGSLTTFGAIPALGIPGWQE